MEKFDTRMVEEYGERYTPFRRLVKVIRFLVDTAYNRVSKAEKEAQPVSVEILAPGRWRCRSPSGCPKLELEAGFQNFSLGGNP